MNHTIMVQYKSDIFNILHERGLLFQCNNIQALDAHLHQSARTVYIGFDPTVSSIHVGTLVVLRTLWWFQKCGHHTIALLGNGTGLVGDPSGKDKMRQMLDVKDVGDNAESIAYMIERLIHPSIITYNATWLKSLNLLDFLRSFGSKISVNYMLTLDSMKSRLNRNHHLSFLEMSYPLMQAYDFYHLHKNYHCTLQIGGSDQWGNMIMGVELIDKTLHDPVFVLTTPLLTTKDGKKMGKTEKGAVFLDAALCSPYDFWQYWRNVSDVDVFELMLKLTDLSVSKIQKMQHDVQSDALNINDVKKMLAYNLTSFVHGEDQAQLATQKAEKIFAPQDFATQDLLSADLPTVYVEKDALPLVGKAIHLSGITSSLSESRRLMKGGGITINGEKILQDRVLNTQDFVDQHVIIRIGKKRYMMVRY